jgi:hypothetical protein
VGKGAIIIIITVMLLFAVVFVVSCRRPFLPGTSTFETKVFPAAQV